MHVWFNVKKDYDAKIGKEFFTEHKCLIKMGGFCGIF